MKSYRQTLRFLYDLQLFGIKVGLKNIRFLLDRVGNPHHQFPVIHIAGTNGKGSTAAMLAAILTASGYRTGFYSSPHLVHFNERIRIDGRKISDDELVKFTKLLRPHIEKTAATFFEATTAIAFLSFAERMVDFAVVETGLGGRLDATNVVTPVLSIITNIGIEHAEYLGHTHAKIAHEKGGIIKPGVPCLAGTDIDTATAVLQTIARRRGSEFHHAASCSRLELLESSLNGSRIRLETMSATYKDLFVSLAGEYQTRNVRLSVLAAEMLKTSRAFTRINAVSIARGLRSVKQLSGWRGRLDVIRESPLVIADVAHNPDGMKALVHSLRRLVPGKLVGVFGVLKDKDVCRMLECILPIVRVLVAVKPRNARGLQTSDIVLEQHRSGGRALDARLVRNGLKLAFEEARNNEAILVTGSHFVVGEAMEELGIAV